MRHPVALVLCLLLSLGIWLITNLSQSYSDVVGVVVVAESSLEGYSRQSSPSSVAARCTATGFRLLSMKLSKPRHSVIEVDPDAFEAKEDGVFSLSSEVLYRYAEGIFGTHCTVESFLSKTFDFHFTHENYRKVPVKGVLLLDFKPQYMASAPVRFTPDSVILYADPDRLADLDAVLTRPVVQKDIRSSLNGIVELEPISGVRLSDTRVTYNLDVTRYVEVIRTVPVSVRNLPDGKVFGTIAYRILLDWVAAVKFLCGGGWADCWAVARAHFAFYRRLPSLRKARRAIPHHQVGQVYQRNIVFDNFIRGKKRFSELDSNKFFQA